MAVFDRSITEGQDLSAIPVEVSETQAMAAAAWGPLRRFFFLFALCYLVLQLIPAYLTLLGQIPHTEFVGGWYMNLWNAGVPWIGQHILHVKAPYLETGSSDSMYSWVETLCFLVLSFAVALVWAILDRKRAHYARLDKALRVFVRIGLAIVMIAYGTSKVVPSQFPAPPLSRLTQPFGEASPMGLLWTFMGASTPYQVFSGLMELISGLLLLFRRTAALGALAAIAVLTNVVMLNFCYDVPVKILSVNLLLIALFLAVPDLRRLFELLVLRRTVAPASDRSFFQRRPLRIVAFALEGLVAFGFTAVLLRAGYQDLKMYDGLKQTPLYGIWRVDDLLVDGHARDAQTADTLRWQNLIFDFPGFFGVQTPEESRRPYTLELDAAHKTMALTWQRDPKWKSALTYAQPTPDHLTMAGTFDGYQIQASLHRIDDSKIRLVSRGFHWVSEYPYNR